MNTPTFGFGAAFGQSQPAASPFGGAPASPFGAPATPFGQTAAASPFGGTTGTSLFGQSQPAFGASTPAFGAATTPAFGAAGAFGAKPATGFGGGFGSTTSSPFGSAQPAFGAASTPAFGAAPAQPAFGAASSTPAFGGSSPFGGGGAFGSATPAFGAGSTPAFGAAATTPAFGSGSAFGATGFGAAGGAAFGGATAQTGTRTAPYQKTVDPEQQTTTGGQKQTMYLNAISAMPAYAGKSFEELRWEDYQAGVKGSTAASSGSTFGGAAAASPFGTPASTPAFGVASTPAFGSSPTPAFGAATPSFGAASSPGFGFGASAGAPAFGSTPAFGASAPAFGTSSAFGSTSTTPGFAASAPAFGQAAATPAFGAGGASPFGAPAASAPAFGASSFGSAFPASTPAFGQASTPAFGLTSPSPFGSSTPAFGAASAPAFGASSSPFTFPSSTPAFGGGTAPAPFGAASTPAFGAASSPAFGNLFGNQPAAKPGGFGLGGNMFGGGSLPFGAAASTPAFGLSPAAPFGGSLFQSSPAQGAFSFSPAGQQPGQLGTSLTPAQAPGVATSPYGVLPQPPVLAAAVPEHRVGISQRPVGQAAGGAVRGAALLTPRCITPRSGVRLRAPRPRSTPRMGSATTDFLGGGGSDGSEKSAGSNGNIFVARDNPRRLFVRDPLPSTSSATTTSASPAAPAAANGTAASEQQHSPRGSSGEAPRPASADRAPSNGRGGSGHLDGGPSTNGDEHYSEHMSDQQIAEVLPRVEAEDYFMEPALTQLAAMAREDPGSLRSVANFTVGRRGVGAVRWLEAVDVWRLRVEETVRLQRGAVEVYLDEDAKPAIGSGLNKPAQVTLQKVFKMDKATGKPTRDPDAIDRFVRKLKKTAAEQNARFLSYDAESGVWKFEVEHFSRYGLLADSDDEETPQAGLAGKRSAPGMAWAEDDEGGEGEVEGMEEGDDALQAVSGDESGEERGSSGLGVRRALGIDMSDDMDDGEAGPGDDETDVGPAESPVLGVALPAALRLDPVALQDMRDSFYPDQPLCGSSKGRRRGAGGVPPSHVAGATAAAPLHAPRSWRRPPPSLLPPSFPPSGTTAGAAASPDGAGGAAVGLLRGRCLVRGGQPGAAAAGQAQRCLVDAGLLMGRSCRVAWGPAAILLHPGGSTAAQVQVKRLQVGAPLLQQPATTSAAAPSPSPSPAATAALARQRQLLRAVLEINLRHSAPQLGVGSTQPPRWTLRCQRRQQLEQLCLEYVGATLTHIKQGGVTGAERTGLQHQAWTWELVRVLFADIPGELEPSSTGTHPDRSALPPAQLPVRPAPEAGGEAEPMVAGGADGVEEMEGDEGGAEGQQRLAAFRRRAALSRWLKDFAAAGVEAALPRGGSAMAQVATLLAGQQLPAAAALAASAGDVRLATLIAQAGLRRDARELVRRQVAVWRDAGFTDHIDADRLRVYRLLAGEVEAVTPVLSLDWRRALALHLWYAHEPSAPVAAALGSYSAAAGAGTASPPCPPHVERRTASTDGMATSATDVDYELLQLWAAAEGAGGGNITAPPLARLLRAGGYSPDPLDAALGWQLWCVLSAIGVLPATAASSAEVFALHLALIGQLEAVGGLAEWAVYVALQLPDAPAAAAEQWRGGRRQLVRALLARHCPEWSASAAATAFLRDRLALPPAWLAEARALWARYQSRPGGEVAALLDAEQWGEAHRVLCADMAPQLLLTQRYAVLEGLLGRLAPHAAAVDAAQGQGAWRRGGGTYHLYLHLKEADAPQDDEPSLQQLSQQLVEAARHAASVESAPTHSAALALMSADLARWLLPHSPGAGHAADLLPRQEMAVQLPALLDTQLMGLTQVAVATLGQVLA